MLDFFCVYVRSFLTLVRTSGPPRCPRTRLSAVCRLFRGRWEGGRGGGHGGGEGGVGGESDWGGVSDTGGGSGDSARTGGGVCVCVCTCVTRVCVCVRARVFVSVCDTHRCTYCRET
jgi:hypothetical protein